MVYRNPKTMKARSAVVFVGSPVEPGWRTKDGPEAVQRRREVRATVAAALGIVIAQVRAQALYSCLSMNDAGYIERRNDRGDVIAIHTR
jgi:hypothetical protein